jgi:predicted membrane protein DUF2142
MAEERSKADRIRRPQRTDPRSALLVVVCAIALVVLGLAWSLASPPGGSPDDDFHLASIWCATGDTGVCRRTGVEVRARVERVLVLPALGPGLVCFALQPERSAACQDEAPHEGGLEPSRANDGLYPGGFYRFMSLFATRNVDRSVLVMRMVSWTLSIALLLVAWLFARPALRAPLALAGLTSLVPLGVYLFASNNPSGVAVAGIAAYWVTALTFLEGGGECSTTRKLALVGVMLAGVVVALVSRSDAGLYVAVASVAAWLSAGGHRVALRRRSLVLAAIACVGIAATLAGRENEHWAGELGTNEQQARTAAVFEAILDVPSRALGALGLGPLGALDTPMPAIVAALMLLAFGGALLIGVAAATREKWLALAAVSGILVALPVLVVSAGENVQPRYLLPLLPVLMGTALVSRPVDPPVRFGRGQALLLVSAVVVAHGAALHRTIRRYVTGVDQGGPDLGASVEWWWGRGPGPMATWALGALAFAVVGACVYRLLVAGKEEPVSGSTSTAFR